MSDSRQPPSLQKLVGTHGTYNLIPQEAWAKFYADLARWKSMVRNGGLHPDRGANR